MKAYLTRRYTISASHRLQTDALTVHQNLNTLAEFVTRVPTTENLATVIYDILKRSFTAAHLERVRIEETLMNSFEYAGGREVHR